jgi:hypothetical protein
LRSGPKANFEAIGQKEFEGPRKKSWDLPCKNMKRDYICIHNARVAQLVEHDLAKVGVASSNLVSRSKALEKGLFHFRSGILD